MCNFSLSDKKKFIIRGLYKPKKREYNLRIENKIISKDELCHILKY